VPSFAFVGALYAKFPRYLLPLTPLLAIYGARMLVALTRRRSWGSFLICAVLICSLLHCLALLNLYRSPHPWLVASAWLTDHVPRGAVVAVEQWDHPLPLDATGYDVRELPVFDEDTPEKWAGMEATLAEADYVIIASWRRGRSAIPSRRATISCCSRVDWALSPWPALRAIRAWGHWRWWTTPSPVWAFRCLSSAGLKRRLCCAWAG
jgi:hypothetical protein